MTSPSNHSLRILLVSTASLISVALGCELGRVAFTAASVSQKVLGAAGLG